MGNVVGVVDALDAGAMLSDTIVANKRATATPVREPRVDRKDDSFGTLTYTAPESDQLGMPAEAIRESTDVISPVGNLAGNRNRDGIAPDP